MKIKESIKQVNDKYHNTCTKCKKPFKFKKYVFMEDVCIGIYECDCSIIEKTIKY